MQSYLNVTRMSILIFLTLITRIIGKKYDNLLLIIIHIYYCETKERTKQSSKNGKVVTRAKAGIMSDNFF